MENKVGVSVNGHMRPICIRGTVVYLRDAQLHGFLNEKLLAGWGRKDRVSDSQGNIWTARVDDGLKYQNYSNPRCSSM